MRHWCFIATSLTRRLIGRIAPLRAPGPLPQDDSAARRGQGQPRRARPAEFAFCDLTIEETDVKVAGARAYVYRAIDERGQVVDVYVSARRAAEDAATCFRRAVAATGVVPDEVATDCAAAYPPALAAALPPVAHEPARQSSSASSVTTSTAKAGCARRAAARGSPGRGWSAGHTPSSAISAVVSTTSGDWSTPPPPRPSRQRHARGTP
jgi:hypothetical protein